MKLCQIAKISVLVIENQCRPNCLIKLQRYKTAVYTDVNG